MCVCVCESEHCDWSIDFSSRNRRTMPHWVINKTCPRLFYGRKNIRIQFRYGNGEKLSKFIHDADFHPDQRERDL